MRRLPIILLCAALPVFAVPATAQAGAAAEGADTVAFDPGEVEEADDGDWGIGEFLAGQAAADQAACASDSDLLAAQSTSRPRYDDNGALIRETPSAGCVPPGSRHSAEAAAMPAGEQRLAAGNDGNGSSVLRQPDCVENASGYRCAATGTARRNTFEREEECRETGTTRTCSSTFSIGSSAESRNAAREALERLRSD